MTPGSPISQPTQAASNERARTIAQSGTPLLPWYRLRNPARAWSLATFVALVAVPACNAGGTRGQLAAALHVDAVEPPFVAATHPAALQVVKAAGTVLAQPVLVLATFNNDPQAASLNDFAGKLAVSGYWNATTREYGVGKLTVGLAQAETFAWPASSTDGDFNAGQPSDIEAFLVNQLDGSSPPWGAPNPQAIYALMMPAGTNVSPNGGSIPSACNANILAWHTAMLLPTSGAVISYVVVPHCGARSSLSVLDSRTMALSHALVEAATDPLLNAYNAVDANHLAWQLATGSPEVGAACVAALGNSSDLWIKSADLPYAAQRTWSNAAAAAGQPPCVPSNPNTVQFSAVPVLGTLFTAVVSSNGSVPQVNTVGVQIGVGTTGVVPLQLYSSGATAPWQVSAKEIGSSVLLLTLSAAAGQNGDTLQLSIEVAAANGTSTQELVQITSTLGSQISQEYLLVHN